MTATREDVMLPEDVNSEDVNTDSEFGLEYCAEALRALGDPIRLQIIQQLRRGPSNVGDLATAIGSSIVNVSHHLGILYNANFLARSKNGRFVVYSLRKQVLIKTARGVEQLDLQCCRLELPEL